MLRPAVSYSRWSRPEQGTGDSLRRQQDQFSAFCQTHHLKPLADSEHPIDSGVSAFRGRNTQNGELGQFLLRVKTDPTLKGVVLVVENQDRLSRQRPWEALSVIKEFIDAGASIGDCMTNRIYDASTFQDDYSLMMLLMGSGQAHRYSEALSMRIKSARARNREQARDGKIVSKRGPFWVRLSADRQRWELIPDRVAHVKLIFELACAGKGCRAITTELEARGIKSPLGKDQWHPRVVHSVIEGREVLGEYQPKIRPTRSTSQPAGDPIRSYYPVVISRKLHDKANALLVARIVQRRGRPSKRVNVFAGILSDMKTEQPFHMETRTRGYAMLHCKYNSGGPSICYEKLLEAFCHAVEEIDPDSLVEPDPEVQSLIEELASIDAKLATIESRVKTEKDIDYLLDLLRDLGRDRQGIKQLLDEAEARRRNPVKQAFKSLKATRIDDPEGFRARLRLAIERMTMHVFRIKDEDGHARKAAWVEVAFRRDIKRAFAFSYRDGGGFLEKPVTMGGTIKVADGKWEFSCQDWLETGDRLSSKVKASRGVGASKPKKVR
jgi:DNA invertase Pin-like site-specific DNA recombinase